MKQEAANRTRQRNSAVADEAAAISAGSPPGPTAMEHLMADRNRLGTAAEIARRGWSTGYAVLVAHDTPAPQSRMESAPAAGAPRAALPRSPCEVPMLLSPALLLAAAAGALLSGRGPDPEPFAITGATVITMTSDRPLRNATVVVRGGRIAAVGPAASTPVPADARRIDGRGMYLMPGLTDMHAHLFADEYAPESAAPAELGLYLALGTTSARLQIGRPQHLELQRAVREGTLPGPRLWVSSPQLSGDSGANTLLVRNAAEARAAVRTANASGYDFIKLTTNITPEVYAAIMAEAQACGMRVTGHVDPRVGVPMALAAGQQIEHLDNYMETVLADSAPSRVSVSDVDAYRAKNWTSLAYVDEAQARGDRGSHGASRGVRHADATPSSSPGSPPNTPTPRSRRAPTIPTSRRR